MNFFDRERVRLIRFKRSNCASSIERAIAKVGGQSVLDYLGVAFANGPDRLLASTPNQLLVKLKIDRTSRHDSKILRQSRGRSPCEGARCAIDGRSNMNTSELQ
jgi:hypothetical protein